MESSTDNLQEILLRTSFDFSGKRFQNPLLEEGDSLLGLGQPENALTRFSKFIETGINEKKDDGHILALIGSLKSLSRLNIEKEFSGRLSELDSLINLNNYSDRLQEDIWLFYGNHYFEQGRGKGREALEAFQNLLEIRMLLHGDTSTHVAGAYSAIGKVYRYRLSSYDQAKIALHNSLRIYDKLENFSKRKLFYNYYWLASTYNKIGDFANAQAYADKAYKLAAQLPKPNVDEVSRGLIILGLIKSDLLQREEAIKYYEQLVPLRDSFQWDSQKSDYTFNNLGANYLVIGKAKLARRMLYQSLKINKNDKAPSALRLTYRNLGALHFLTHELDSALYYYKRALNVNKENIPDDRIQIAHFNHSIGGIFQRKNQPDSALLYFQVALQNGFPKFRKGDFRENPVINKEDNNHELFNILSSKGSLWQEKFKMEPGNTSYLKLALECYLKADSVIMMNRASFDHETSKLNMASVNYGKVYADAIECVYLLDSIEKDSNYRNYAFLFMEKNKSMILFEALSKNNRFRKSGIDTSLRNRELKLIEQVSINEHKKKLAQSDLEKAIAENLPEVTINRLGEILELQRELSIKLIKEGVALKKDLKAEEPEYFNQKYGEDFHNLESSAEQLEKEGRVIIEFFKTEEAIFALVFKKGYSNLVKIPYEASLKKALSIYQADIKTGVLPGTNGVAQFQKFKEVAHFLFQKLVADPLKKLDQKPDNLVVVLDPALGNLPLEAFVQESYPSDNLNYKKLDYLVRDIEICYAFSANILIQNMDASKQRVRPDVVGFSYLNTENVGSLPGASKETRIIQEIMGGKSFDGPKATKACFKKEIKNKDLIHLSIHGRGDTSDTYSSCLYFVDDSTRNDGKLFAYDLYNLDLDAQLVVLSACESGVGAKAKGEGVYSIARGFAFAGCPSQVITFWKINDNAAVEIMRSFYLELAKRSSVGSALRSAKLQFIESESEYRAHPSNWGAFIVLGNADLSFKKPRK